MRAAGRNFVVQGNQKLIRGSTKCFGRRESRGGRPCEHGQHICRDRSKVAQSEGTHDGKERNIVKAFVQNGVERGQRGKCLLTE